MSGPRVIFTCQCEVTSPNREPECPLPVTQEDMLCDHCRAGHPESGQAAYDSAVETALNL